MIPSNKDDADLGSDLLDDDAEFDEAWDDFLEIDEDADHFNDVAPSDDLTQANHHEDTVSSLNDKNKKSNTPIKLGLVFVLLCAACSGGYYYYTQNPQKKPVIVQIEPELINSVTPSAVINSPELTEEVNTRIEADIPPEQVDEILEKSENEEQAPISTVDTDGPLTPIPANLQGLDIDLPDLNEAPEDDNLASPPSSNDDSNIIESHEIIMPVVPEFSEDAMLSKTESDPKLIEEIKDTEEVSSILNLENHVAPNLDSKEVVIENVTVNQPVENESIVSTSQEKQQVSNKVDKKTPALAPAPVKAETKITKPAAIEWQIRAAQPGKAVIYDRKNDVMRSVEIGDYLAETGKIINIKKINGKWTISGPKGNITN